MSEILFVDVDLIVPNKYNPNKMSDEIFQSLLEDARLHGAEALDPISVRPLDFLEGEQHYEIIDGESRWKVAQQLQWKRIRAIVQKVSLDEAKSINYRKNRERGTIDPFKEAQLFKAEYDAGLSQEQISVKYGVPRTYVTEHLPIAIDVTEETKSIVERSTMLTPSHLVELAKVKEPEQQKGLAEKIVTGDLSVRETASEVKRLLEPIQEGEEKPKEVKKCLIERLFQEDILPKLIVRRDQTMNCAGCPLNPECKQTIQQLESFARFIVDVVA